MFWKLNLHAPIGLTWLDGYYRDSKTNQNTSENVDFGDKNGIPSSARNCLQLLLTAMSSLQHPLGEGFVGKVAATGDHCWVFCDNIFNWEFNTSLISECPDEWLYQLTFGIKTVVVIPVLPHGVLHLGSFEMVAENMAMVASARRWLNVIFCMSDNGDNSALAESFSCLIHSPLDIMDGSSFTAINPTADNADFTPSTSRNSVDGQSLQISEEILEFPRNANMDDIDFPPNWMYVTQETDGYHAGFQSMNGFVNDLQVYSQVVNNFVAVTEGLNEVAFTKDTEEEQTRNADIRDSSHKHVNDSLKLSADYELPEALIPVGDEQTDKYFTDGFFVEDGCSSSKLNSNVNYHHDTEVLWLAKGEDETDYLLDAVVGKLCSRSTSDDILSSISNNTRASGQVSVMQQHTQTQKHKSIMENPGLNIHVKPAFDSNSNDLSKIAPEPATTQRDVTEQAEKLRRYVYSEVVESKRSTARKEKHPGKSYAFEFGNEHQICPIIIEDLEFTQHMRIDMICDEHGMFLEIVETIRRLELIILKGVLENNKNTKWARFIVEVPKAFNRMEIFWPLMHLLQLRTKPI